VEDREDLERMLSRDPSLIEEGDLEYLQKNFSAFDSSVSFK